MWYADMICWYTVTYIYIWYAGLLTIVLKLYEKETGTVSVVGNWNEHTGSIMDMSMCGKHRYGTDKKRKDNR